MKHSKEIENMTLVEKCSFVTGGDFWSSKEFEGYGTSKLVFSDKSLYVGEFEKNPNKEARVVYPELSCVANSWDTELLAELGRHKGAECRKSGENVLLAPDVNVKRNPKSGLNFKCFSEDPYLTGKLAAAYVGGVQSQGVLAMVRRYALNNQVTREMSVDTIVDERAMRELYLTAFEIVVRQAKPLALMTAYNRVNGIHANESTHLMQTILRDEWGYDGVVISDQRACNDRVKAIIACNELEVPNCLFSENDLVYAVQHSYINDDSHAKIEVSDDSHGEVEVSEDINGVGISSTHTSLSEEVLDRSVRNLLDVTNKLKQMQRECEPIDLNLEEAHAFAKKCADESIILLKNKDDILPLRATDKVAIIGDYALAPHYRGTVENEVPAYRCDSTASLLGFARTKNGLEKTLESAYDLDVVGIERGFVRDSLITPVFAQQAKELAKKADIAVVYLGMPEWIEAEWRDRKKIKLSSMQINLLSEIKALGKKVIAIVHCGCVIEMPFDDYIDGVVYAGLGGEAVAESVLDVLTGKVNPSGKTSESFMFNYRECPTAMYFPAEQMTAECRESIFVGYRYYETANVDVRYPFGYGLSYTQFEYSGFEVTGDGVKVTVTNIGERAGKEIVQLYVGRTSKWVYRAAKELKGFVKISLNAGESKTVYLPFDEYTFRFYNVESLAWEVESGEYNIMVGSSCRDIKLDGVVVRDGVSQTYPYDIKTLGCYFNADIKQVQDKAFREVLSSGDMSVHYQLPPYAYPFYKRNRMVITADSTIGDMRYAKRWVARLVARMAKLSASLMSRLKGSKINSIKLHDLPLRSAIKYGNMTRTQLDGVIMICNGKAFKGFGMIMKRNPKKASKSKKNNADVVV